MSIIDIYEQKVLIARSQRLSLVIRIISVCVFGCSDVSFFQYFLACVTLSNLIDKFIKKLNNHNGMKIIFTWWTGATLGRSCVIFTNRKEYYHDMIDVARRFDSCLSSNKGLPKGILLVGRFLSDFRNIKSVISVWWSSKPSMSFWLF